jgi:hypothetical protein
MIFVISNYLSKNKWISCLVTLFAIYALRLFFTARAQMLSYMLFILELFFIEKYYEKHKKRYIAFLWLIALLLANVHMAVYPMFFVFLLPYIVEEIIAKIISKITKKDEICLIGKIYIKNNNTLKSLAIIVLGGIIAGLINPSGFTPFTYTIKTMMGTTTKYIGEHSPLTLVFLKSLKAYIVLYIIPVLIIIWPKIKVKLHDIFLICGLIIISIISVRNLSLLALLSAGIFAKYLNDIKEQFLNLKIFKGAKFIVLRIGVFIFLTFMILFSSYKFFEKHSAVEYISEGDYPITSANWIKENMNLDKLRIFNTYAVGSYLTLAEIPNFIDTRCDLYSAEFNSNLEKGHDIFLDCMKIEDDNSSYKEIFEKYDINSCIIGKTMIIELEDDEDFEKVYEDDYYRIYVRKDCKDELLVK